MKKSAALADAQRNMLNTKAQLWLDADKTVKTAMLSKNVAFNTEGFRKGFTIVSERENGKFEVMLELPLTDPAWADKIHNRMVLNSLLPL